jgi:hypothetical protein
MRVTTLHEVETALRSLDHETLREMAFQEAKSHHAMCRLTSKLNDCAHISDDDTRDRVDGLTDDELAGLLAPTAWMSVLVHGAIEH